MHTKLELNICTRTGIKHEYQGVQGACPQQAVTSTGGTAELARPVLYVDINHVTICVTIMTNHNGLLLAIVL